MASSTPEPWSVIAHNLPEHADNAIHTDLGAQAAGFANALVAGVTTYAYLTHPIVAAWGEDWLAGGGGEVRFRSPVIDLDVLWVVPELDGDAVRVEARADRLPGGTLATLRALRRGGPPPDLRPGEELPVLATQITAEFGLGYAARAGDDLAIYAERGIVHPVVWLSLANRVTHANVVRGPWIHVRSNFRHHRLVPVGEVVVVHSRVISRFQRSGERAILDVRIDHDGRPVASIEHEAIVALPDPARAPDPG